MLSRMFSPGSVAGDMVWRVGQMFATRIALLVMSVISGVIIARSLGPAGRGEYAVASSVAAIGAQFAMLGLHATNTHYLALDRNRLSALLGNSLMTSWLVGGVLSFSVILVLTLMPGLIDLHGVLLLLAAFAVPVYASFTLLQNLLLGLYETGRYNRVELQVQALSLVLLVIIVLAGWQSSETVYGSSLIVSMLALLGMASWLARQNGGVRVSLSLLKDHSGFSLRAYLSTLIFLLANRLELLIVSHFLGAESTGHFSIAVGIADVLGMLAVVTGNVLFPKLSSEPSASERWRLASRTALMIGFLVFCGGVLSLCLAEFLVVLLYGENYLPAAAAYLWLVPGVLFLAVNTILMIYFAAEGMPIIVVVSPIALLVTKLLLGLLLIQQLGLQGAAIASTTGFALMLVMSSLYLWLWKPMQVNAS